MTPPFNTPVWETGKPLGLAALRGDHTADVCVIGLGGSGLSAIGWLLEHGVRVVGLDAGPVAGGAAGRNGGFLLAGLALFYPEAVERLGRERARALYAATVREVDRIATELPEVVRRTGSLRIAMSPDELKDCERHRAALEEDGFVAAPYAGPEGEGLFFPDNAAFQPLERARILARRAISSGAQLFEHSPAVSISGDEVRTPEGRVICGGVLVAVDGALPQVLPELADRVRTVRLQMLATAPAPEVNYPHPVYARYGLEYWQQLPDRRIALGGFRDKGGEGEWTTDAVPASPVQDHLERLLREHLRVTAPITHRWAAPVSYTEDRLPVCGEIRPRVWAVGAYSGTGNVLGPLAARAAAGALLGNPAAVALFTP